MTGEAPGAREFRRQFFRTRLAEPLDLEREEDRDWYAPVHAPGVDPLVALEKAISDCEVQSVQLVPGVRGVGRTTGLRQLARRLGESARLVIEVDISNLLDVHAPVAGGDLVVALVGAIDDALLGGVLEGAVTGASSWARVGAMLPREVCPLGEDPAQRTREIARGRVPEMPRLYQALSGRGAETWDALVERYDDLLGAIRRAGLGRLVVVAHGLERLGPSASSGSVTGPGTVARLLLARGRNLALPETHLVFPVSPAVWWSRAAICADVPLAHVHWWPGATILRRDGTVDDDVLGMFVRLVDLRGDWRRLVKQRDDLERLVRASGGVVRELLNLVRESILAAGTSEQDVVGRAMAARRQALEAQLPAVSAADVALVHETHRIESRDLLTRLVPLLQDGLLVGYAEPGDPEPWFDLHPLLWRAFGFDGAELSR